MPPAIHSHVRNALGHGLCLFCLLRPLWGWMDRKTEPEAPPVSRLEVGEKPKREANVLGDMLAAKGICNPIQSQGDEK